jgi:uncharacterized surface protein with fasciclin (FAS1) repeats
VLVLAANTADIPSCRAPRKWGAASIQLKENFMNTLIDVAAADGHFKTLAKALTAAGLIDTLKGAGPFTVFAPTDDAFAKLPAGTVDGLLKDIPKLTAILKYHVLAGKVAAADVMKLDGKTATTLNGADLKVSTTGGVKLNGKVNVTKTDVAASNGLIHVIDAVLLPAA